MSMITYLLGLILGLILGLTFKSSFVQRPEKPQKPNKIQKTRTVLMPITEKQKKLLNEINSMQTFVYSYSTSTTFELGKLSKYVILSDFIIHDNNYIKLAVYEDDEASKVKELLS